MNTQFVTSNDGTRIAYDITGIGSAIVVLHSGGRTRIILLPLLLRITRDTGLMHPYPSRV
jgi:hypothetical protein